MKKKVIFLIPSLNGGGAERVFIQLLKVLDRNVFEIYLMVTNLEGPYVNEIPNDINIIDLQKTSVKRSLFSLIKEINKIKPNVIISTLFHMNLALLIISPFLIGRPRIILREANPPRFSMGGLPKGKLFIWLYSRLYKRSDAIVAISTDVSNDIQKTLKVKKEKIRIIYNPVDISGIQKKSREKVLHKWFNEKNVPIIISVGRLVEQKDHTTLIKAFAKVRRKKLCKLLILGEGYYYTKLKKMVDNLNLSSDVEFLGFVSNPFKYIHNSDLFVLSSKWEGFGMVLIETLALGTPIVSTDCLGGPHEILNNGEYGKLVPVGNDDIMADKIIEMLNNPSDKKKLISRAMDFDISKIKTQYEQILNNQ